MYDAKTSFPEVRPDLQLFVLICIYAKSNENESVKRISIFWVLFTDRIGHAIHERYRSIDIDAGIYDHASLYFLSHHLSKTEAAPPIPCPRCSQLMADLTFSIVLPLLVACA